MDIQILLNIVFGVAMFSMGFIMEGFRSDIKKISENQQSFEYRAVETFARKDIVNENMARIETVLGRIEDKLDRKADRHNG